MSEIRREHVNAVKTSQEQHSATVTTLEAGHAATITGALHISSAL